MKILLLHYWLVNDRGGEKVFKTFASLFSDADILTHVYDAEKFSGVFAGREVNTTFIGSLPGARKHYRKYLLLMPAALSRTEVSEYDFLLSSESGPVKGVRKSPGAVHVCYCHTPMRYVWDMYGHYRKRAGVFTRAAMSCSRRYLCAYDLKSAERVDYFIANSSFVADRIKKIYQRDATVINPPVATDYYSRLPRRELDFFLYAGELSGYKRPDIAVESFVRNGRKLVVAGDGEEMRALRKLAAGCRNIEFRGRVLNHELRELYRSCRALIFPGIEDFGIVPLEAQAAGAPVIAYGAGGALETVSEHRSGLFFGEQTVESLLEAVERFDAATFEESLIKSHAARFSEANFTTRMKKFLLQCEPRLSVLPTMRPESFRIVPESLIQNNG